MGTLGVEVEGLYEEVQILDSSKLHYKIVMRDFNAKVGTKTGSDTKVENFGFEKAFSLRKNNYIAKQTCFLKLEKSTIYIVLSWVCLIKQCILSNMGRIPHNIVNVSISVKRCIKS